MEIFTKKLQRGKNEMSSGPQPPNILRLFYSAADSNFLKKKPKFKGSIANNN